MRCKYHVHIETYCGDDADEACLGRAEVNDIVAVRYYDAAEHQRGRKISDNANLMRHSNGMYGGARRRVLI